MLTAAALAELVDELTPLCVGRTVLEVAPLPPRDLLIVLGSDDPDAGVRRLRVSADPEAPRLHLQIAPVRSHTGPVGPFFERLAERLVDARCTGLTALAGERSVRLAFRAPAGPCSLFGEFFGRNANLVLVDRDDRIEDVLALPKPGTRSAERLAPGTELRPPGRRNAPDEAESTTPQPLVDLLPAPPARGGLAALAPLSWRVEASLGALAEAKWIEGQRKDLANRLERRLRAARHLATGLTAKLASAEEAERDRMDGELLLSNLHVLKRGMTEARLTDLFSADQSERTIPLDPRRTPHENADRFFARYKKSLRSLERVPEELERAQAEATQLELLLEEARSDTSDPDALEARARRDGLLVERQPKTKKGPRKPAARLPYRTFRGSKGSEIRVGKSARDNDELSLKLARGNDLWLHTAGAPGSHVVLVLAGQKAPDDDEVLDAAHLALHYSPLRGARRADIHIARCKQLRKPKRAPAGLVEVGGGKTLSLRVEDERLARLLETR